MGCFNKIGFYSHLPIICGDPVVVFICCEADRDNTPVYCGSAPICAPIFGTYDDYGCINTDPHNKSLSEELLEKASGLSISDLMSSIHRYGLENINDIDGEIEHLSYDKDGSLYKDAFGYRKLLYGIIGNLNCVGRENIRVFTAMEHLSVYNELKKIGARKLSKEREENFRQAMLFADTVKNAKNKNTFSSSFAHLIVLDNMSKELGENLSFDEYSRKFEEAMDKAEKLSWLTYNETLGFGCLYDIQPDFKYGPNIEDFIDLYTFNAGLVSLCGVYSVSPYGDQDIDSKMDDFLSLNKIYSDIIGVKKKEYDEYSDEYDEE